MAFSYFTWIFNVIASFIGVLLRRLFGRFLPEELSGQTIDTSKDDEIEITSSSCSRRYDVFPSFRGEDVRNSFLSHLLKALDRKSINTFVDEKIERSCPISPELLLAIKKSKIAIVIFSKNYASSTWCLNELAEIHKCYKELNQMVIPVFYNVDPSEVRKQTGEFGKVFNKTCKDKTEDQKQRWMQALADVASLAGEHIHNGCNEAHMIEKISYDVSNKLFTPSDDSDNLVGIETHIEAMKPMLCLESEEVIMVGIVGPSGIGKTTIGSELYNQLSRQFHHRSFRTYEITKRDHYRMRLDWEQQLLSEIIGQEDLKICHSGMVEQRLKQTKVLIVLDDVDDLELLNTLVGKSRWFGAGSRIIVITQDRRLFKAHEIDLIYEVPFPSKDLALKMFCRSAFGQNSPVDGFMELAVEVTELAGKLPLGLSVLGSSLKGRGKHEWIEMLPRFRNDLDGKIEKVLRVGYDRLDRRDRELFLYLAFACKHVFFNHRDLIGDSVDTNTGLKMLVEKSLIRITPGKNVEMHNLLQSLGREIVRAESIYEPGKRRFLEDFNDIVSVLTNKTGTGTLLGICLKIEDLDQPLNIHKKALKGMHNLQILIINRKSWGPKNEVRLYLPQDFANLPSNLRLLEWDGYPSKYLPLNFKAEFLVELRMVNSKLEKLWEGGTQPLGRLKRMFMSGSRYLKEIPDLSNAINLRYLDLSECESLVTLPSSIQNAIKLRDLNMENCTKLESLPALLNLESLERLNLKGCFRLRNFPQVYLVNWILWFHENDIEVEEDCLWNKNPHEVLFLDFFRKCVPRQLRTRNIVYLTVRDSMIEKLWEGVQSLVSLQNMDLSECGNLKEFPDLSKATHLKSLKLNNCKSLVTFPSTIGNLQKLSSLEMKGCTGLEVLPTDVNLSSLKNLDLSGCKRLTSFPQISWSIRYLNLDDTAIEEVPCCIENISMLTGLWMRGCKRLKNISPNIFRLKYLKIADFSECVQVVTALGDVSMVETMENFRNVYKSSRYWDLFPDSTDVFKFNNCYNLDGDAQELILRSHFMPTILPGGRVPKYFTHRSSRNYITVNVPQSSLSQEFWGFKLCVVLEPSTNPNHYAPCLRIRRHFRGVDGWHYVKLDMIYNTDHLLLVPLKFRTVAPSELDYNNDVEFEFFVNDYEPTPFQMIKGCGIRFLDVSPSPAGSDGSKKPLL